jgi:zinc/manganese transport system substrate-binding protein
MLRTLLLSTVALAAAHGTAGDRDRQSAPVRVVATLPVYAELVREIGGQEVEVSSIANPNEDAHFVRPKPSFALDLRRADAFITTGLDLELWVPTLLDRAGNPRVLEGGRGYITAYTGIELLDIPAAADRSAGDVHIFGNPHLTTDPLRAVQVARNINVGLKRVAPDRAEHFDRGLADFTDRIHSRLFGERLVELLGGATLEQLALGGNLFEFLEGNEFEGTPLIDELGGWLAEAAPFRGREIICYHKNWAYFEDRFSVRCADYIEAKPGIPPTPGHVAQLIGRMRDENLDVLLAATYFDEDRVQTVANRGGATAVRVPLSPGAVRGVDDYFSLVDTWVSGLARQFATN